MIRVNKFHPLFDPMCSFGKLCTVSPSVDEGMHVAS